MNNLTYIGVDVSKAYLDVASNRGLHRCPNRPTSIAGWLRKLPTPSHLIVEATGGYERTLVEACHRLGLAISVLNPARVRHFAKARGALAKTDAIDARVLREFGAALQPKAQAPLAPTQRELAELITTRDQLVKIRTQLSNSLEQARLPLVRQTVGSQIRLLDRRIAKLEKAMAACLQQPTLAPRAGLLLAQAGIGLQTAAVLLAQMPELGSLNRNQAAALAGLAPYNRDSGTLSGPRYVGHGRCRLRRALYMATLSAIRASGPLANFYHHLRSSGKPPKVALIASARKLICFLNSGTSLN